MVSICDKHSEEHHVHHSRAGYLDGPSTPADTSLGEAESELAVLE